MMSVHKQYGEINSHLEERMQQQVWVDENLYILEGRLKEFRQMLVEMSDYICDSFLYTIKKHSLDSMVQDV